MSQRTSEKTLGLTKEVLSELRERVIYMWEEGRTQSMETADNAERRALAQKTLKRMAREVFLTQPTATEEDFERCWPELRDRMFLEYTLDLASTLIMPDRELGGLPLQAHCEKSRA